MKSLLFTIPIILASYSGLTHATEVQGRFIGTVGEVSFDESIVCLGKPSPDSFFQNANSAPKGDQPAIKINGGRAGKNLNLIVEGKGVILRTRITGVSIQEGKVTYQGTKKLKNGKPTKIDIALWCE